MGFLDTLKVKPNAPAPSGVKVELPREGRELTIGWSDGRANAIPARLLRQACPCAGCVDEWTNKRTFDPEKIPADVRIRDARPVGNYALAISFSDGHATGIFPWTMLRELSDKLVEPKK